ncbi:MAG: 30S ribosomal protein S16 [Ornithinimicrobium sp.]
MAVKIRLKRMGKIRAPFYRVVVMDARAKRDGRAIEEIGKYHPTAEPSLIDIDSERAQHWLSVGAQPTEQVQALLKVTGDWAKFTGEGDPAGTLRFAPPPPDKKALYEAALAAADGADAKSAGPTRKAKKADSDDAAKADVPAAEKADKASADKPAKDKPADDEPVAEVPAAEADAPAAESATSDEAKPEQA